MHFYLNQTIFFCHLRETHFIPLNFTIVVQTFDLIDNLEKYFLIEINKTSFQKMNLNENVFIDDNWIKKTVSFST